jgi:hypothetical protein
VKVVETERATVRCPTCNPLYEWEKTAVKLERAAWAEGHRG